MSTIAEQIAEVLARPDVRQALQDAHRAEELENERTRRQRRERKAADAPFVQRALTHFNVKGTWTAEEVEPCLASPRSSLNPAFILNGDEL